MSKQAPTTKPVAIGKALEVTYLDRACTALTVARAKHPDRVEGERLSVRHWHDTNTMEVRHITGTYISVKELSPTIEVAPMSMDDLIAYAEGILSPKGGSR
jgi:hypothetical protein